jgi:transcriptional regulator with XRE-family HTH domain
MLSIKDNIRTARIGAGLSLQDLANSIGNVVSRQALYRYEKGEVIPSQLIIEKIAKATNKTVNWFNRTSKIEINVGEIYYHKIKFYN